MADNVASSKYFLKWTIHITLVLMSFYGVTYSDPYDDNIAFQAGTENQPEFAAAAKPFRFLPNFNSCQSII